MTITETEIAMIFFKRNFKRVDEAWPHIYNKLKGMLSKSYPFEIVDEEEAKMMLTFAVISIEIQNLKKFFPDQSERILNKFMKIINSLEESDYVNKKLLYIPIRFKNLINNTRKMNDIVFLRKFLFSSCKIGLATM
jgi:hypothetical protein